MLLISKHDITYLDALEEILEHGNKKTDRTGVGTISLFAQRMQFDLSDGSIPLLTTKKMSWNNIIHELLWYLTGEGNTKYLNEHGVHIWNAWSNDEGDLGPIYGVQWRSWSIYEQYSDNPVLYKKTGVMDQIQGLINTIRTNPDDRRLLVSAWNVADLHLMALPPCHYVFQCYVNDGKLSLMVNQRSCDFSLGVPYNIVQYAILLRMIAHLTNLAPGELIWSGGDCHIYLNQIEMVKEQLTRSPYNSPFLKFAREVNDIDDFKFEDFVLTDYKYHPAIKIPIAV